MYLPYSSAHTIAVIRLVRIEASTLSHFKGARPELFAALTLYRPTVEAASCIHTNIVRSLRTCADRLQSDS